MGSLGRLFVSTLAAFALAAACSPAADERPVTTAIVGASGGKAVSANGRLKIQVPPGALVSSMTLTIQQIDAPAPGAVGHVFEVGPTGTTFSQPVTLTLRFTEEDLGGGSPYDLRIATFARGAWQAVESIVNPSTSVAAAQITHLSPWTLVLGPGFDPTGTGGTGGGDGTDLDAGVDEDASQDDAGAGADATPGADAGADVGAGAGADADLD